MRLFVTPLLDHPVVALAHWNAVAAQSPRSAPSEFGGRATRPASRKGRGGLLRDLGRDRRGAIMTEYVVLVGTMGLAVVFAIMTVGPKLVNDFTRARNITASPIP